tara:strand:+ start:10001 stop:10399 length:399 start_codon:yes stop_codon:yes gene_type:complete
MVELVTLLDFGYGFVDMGDHRLIGLRRDVECRIGKFDEQIVRKSDAAWDMCLRMRDADIAIYRTHICPVALEARDYEWDLTDNYFDTKWILSSAGKYTKNKTDIVADCKTSSVFLPWNKSVLSDIPLMHEAL